MRSTGNRSSSRSYQSVWKGGEAMVFSRGNRHMATNRQHNKRPRKTNATRGVTAADRKRLAHAIHNRGEFVTPGVVPATTETSAALRGAARVPPQSVLEAARKGDAAE